VPLEREEQREAGEAPRADLLVEAGREEELLARVVRDRPDPGRVAGEGVRPAQLRGVPQVDLPVEGPGDEVLHVPGDEARERVSCT
jgi:hypothetical protein